MTDARIQEYLCHIAAELKRLNDREDKREIARIEASEIRAARQRQYHYEGCLRSLAEHLRNLANDPVFEGRNVAKRMLAQMADDMERSIIP